MRAANPVLSTLRLLAALLQTILPLTTSPAFAKSDVPAVHVTQGVAQPSPDQTTQQPAGTPPSSAKAVSGGPPSDELASSPRLRFYLIMGLVSALAVTLLVLMWLFIAHARATPLTMDPNLRGAARDAEFLGLHHIQLLRQLNLSFLVNCLLVEMGALLIVLSVAQSLGTLYLVETKRIPLALLAGAAIVTIGVFRDVRDRASRRLALAHLSGSSIEDRALRDGIRALLVMGFASNKTSQEVLAALGIKAALLRLFGLDPLKNRSRIREEETVD